MADGLLALGVDGAPRGWLAAACYASSLDAKPVDRRTALLFRPRLAELAEWAAGERGGDPPPTAVDVPLGVMELGGPRPCDKQARAALKGKAGSVFNPPGRFLLEELDETQARDYSTVARAVARRKDRAAPGEHVPGYGSTAAGILPKVHEANAFMRATRRGPADFAAEEWMFEVHPELSFDQMRNVALDAGTEMPVPLGGDLATKYTPRGVIERFALVRHAFPDVDVRAAELDWPQRHGVYDVLDAYAALWTALRDARHDGDTSRLFGDGHEEPPRDEHGVGLMMQIVI